MYSTGTLFFFTAATMSSDSGLMTRGSLAPWSTIKGLVILSAANNGEIERSLSSSVSGLPISWYKDLRNDSQYGGMLFKVRTQLEIPNRSTPARNSSG